MARRISKIICPACKEVGGTLTLRKAGNTKNKKRRYSYFYIKHFSPSSKHKSASCYIGHLSKLAKVKLNDPRYRTYENALKSAYAHGFDSENMNLLKKAEDALESMGFPRKFVRHKSIADNHKAFLEIEYEKHKEKGILQDIRYELFDRRLNWRVEEAIDRKVRYSERRLG